jgi:hypothetical protein
MKYLKKYNESYSDNNLVDVMNDILLDISDLGFYIHVAHGKGKFVITTVTISRLRNVKGFIRTDEELRVLKETLNRIKEYAESCDYKVDLIWVKRINNLNIEEFNEIMDNNRFTIHITMFKK